MSEVALVEKENAKTTGLFEELNSVFSQKHRTVQDKKKQAKDMIDFGDSVYKFDWF